MVRVTSGEMARFDWLKNIFAGPLFSRDRPRSKTRNFTVKCKKNKLRHANSKTQNKRNKKNIYECDSKEKHLENSLTIQTIQFETIYFLWTKTRKVKANRKKTARTSKKTSFVSGQIMPYNNPFKF